MGNGNWSKWGKPPSFGYLGTEMIGNKMSVKPAYTDTVYVRSYGMMHNLSRNRNGIRFDSGCNLIGEVPLNTFPSHHQQPSTTSQVTLQGWHVPLWEEKNHQKFSEASPESYVSCLEGVTFDRCCAFVLPNKSMDFSLSEIQAAGFVGLALCLHINLESFGR